MSKETITITDDNRNEFGGDVALLDSAKDKFGKQRPISRDNTRYVGLFDIYPGDIVNKNDPTAEFNFKWHQSGRSDSARREWMHMTLKEGFVPCEYDDWDIRPELRPVFTKSASGQIILGDDKYETILMYRTAKKYRDAVAALRAETDAIADTSGNAEAVARDLGLSLTSKAVVESSRRRR